MTPRARSFPVSRLALVAIIAVATSCATDLCTSNDGGCPEGDAGACGPANCTGCCTPDGVCHYPGLSNATCGIFGVTCAVCTGGSTQCNANGQCQNLGGCTGCRDGQGRCQQGNSTSACGANGAACQICGSGQSCSSGQCVGGSTDAGCAAVGTGCSGTTNNCCSQYCLNAACACNIGGNIYPCVTDADCCVANGKSTGCGANGLCQ